MDLKGHLFDLHFGGHEDFLEKIKRVAADPTTTDPTADFKNQLAYSVTGDAFYICTATATASKWKALET